jgi:hypothetical protein
VTAPVNLTVAPFGVYYCIATNTWSASDNVFFNRFFGRSPQDFGAKGDTQVYFNCGMTTNNHATCATGHFQATDVGKWIESCAAAGCASGATVNQGTITVFNSSTDVTTSVTAGTTYSNTKLAFGTDDDAAMQSWAASMTGAPTNGVPPQVRGGYIPQGGYAIKQPLKIIYPASCGPANAATCGEGAPAQNYTGGLSPGLWLTGASTPASFIYVRTAGVFTWPTTSDDTGAITIGNWSFGNISNFAIIADQSAHNTTGVTGNVGGLNFAGWLGGAVSLGTHNYVQSLWIQGFHNTTNNLCGLTTSKMDFESSYTYSAVEANDFNGCFGNSQSGQTGATLLEKIHVDTVFFENPNSINIVVGTTASGSAITLSQLSFTNCHAFNGTTAVRFISASSQNGESIQFYNFRETSVSNTYVGFRVDGGVTTVDLHGSNLLNTSGTAGDVLVSNLGASATVNLYGGTLNCTSCTNLFNNAGNIFIYGTSITSGQAVANFQTGAGNTYSFIPVAGANGGWNGKGTIQGTLIASNQGAAPVNANFALSGGWGTTATVTATSGFPKACVSQSRHRGRDKPLTQRLLGRYRQALPCQQRRRIAA